MSRHFGVHSHDTNVVAVVVTYNRRALLGRCIAALRAQDGGLQRILVVDNASTDGTRAMLEAAAREPGIPLEVLRSSRNLGGAGGFAAGMDAAMTVRPHWLWLMDDDTEPEPNALLELLEAAGRARLQGRAPIGFLASQVLWRDGSSHRMNEPGRMSRRTPTPAPEDLVAVDYASFVSLLVSSEAVLACGLPIAEFFIGSDDVEYTWRITKAGYLGFEVPASRVRHLTERNAGMTLWNLQVTEADVETWAIKTRNLVAVNRRRPLGRFRETLRLLLLGIVWRQRGMEPKLRRRLVEATREGLNWNYEPLIRRLPRSEGGGVAHPRHPA